MGMEEANKPLIQQDICPPIVRYLEIKLLFCKKKTQKYKKNKKTSQVKQDRGEETKPCRSCQCQDLVIEDNSMKEMSWIETN